MREGPGYISGNKMKKVKKQKCYDLSIISPFSSLGNS